MSIRADVITRRTYNRPLNEEGTVFETWEQTITRVINHQRWLWERALTHKQMPEMPLKDLTEDMNEWVCLDDDQEAELEELYDLLISRKVAVAGRTLWLGGTPIAKRREASQMNCAFTDVATIYDVVDLFWLLLQGSGVGLRPVVGSLTGFRKYIPKLEVIRSKGLLTKGRETNEEHWDPESSTWTISIGDSAEAWAKSIGKLLAGKYPASKLVLDFSEIRKDGIRLKNYGWISQGDKGISAAYAKIFEILNAKADAHLTEIDILDICNLLGTVLSTRRSAEIAVLDSHNKRVKEFARAKAGMWENGNQHRAQSNNSIVFWHKPSKEELSGWFEMINSGGNGEPGLINGRSLQERAPWATGLNPCITSDMLITTNLGLRRVSDLIGIPFIARSAAGDFNSLNGFFSTGVKEVFKISTDTGQYIKATANHKVMTKEHGWVEVEYLNLGDHLVVSPRELESYNTDKDEFDKGWLVGEVIGDGGHNPDKYPTYVRFWGDSAKEMSERTYDILNRLFNNSSIMVRDKNPASGVYTCASANLGTLANKYLEKGTKAIKDNIFSESESFIKGFLRGFFDADGSVQGNLQKGVSIRLPQANIQTLELVQQLLLSVGIKSTIYKNRKASGKYQMPDGNGGSKEYMCKVVHELIISKQDFVLYTKMIGFYEPEKSAKLDIINKARKRDPYKSGMYTRVLDITSVGEEEVYDCTVEQAHEFVANGIVVHNCGEILLPSKGFCNLTSIDLSKFKGDVLGLYKAAKIITRANYRQTIVDFRDGLLQESWHLNNEHLHLCGVSLMGVATRPDMSPYDYRRLERTITTAGFGMAKELNLPYPKNLTTVKPEGTQSKCYDSTEGMHKPLGKYIFNNVAFSSHDPLLPKLREAGYKVFNHPYDNSATLVTFPIQFDNIEFDTVDGKEVNLESAIDQLERYKMLMDSYCHQNVSCTISYSLEETEEIVDWLYNNWDNYVAVAFLFRNDPTKTAADLGYPYLPQEVTTKELYDEYVSRLKPVDLDQANSSEELLEDGCAGGVCPIR